MNEEDLIFAYRNTEVEEKKVEKTGKEEGEESEEGERETHLAHAALGENHWFTCPLCDDEDPDG